MKIVAVTQARVGSTRLPAKVLQQIAGKTLLQMHLERAGQARRVDSLVVATTNENGSEKIEAIATAAGAGCVHGSVEDVLDRFYQAVKNEGADYIVRITSDCPLLDPQLVDDVISYAVAKQVDYVSNTLVPSFPDGQDIEVFTFQALEKAWQEAALLSEREHVTPYIWKNSSFHQKGLFSSSNYRNETDYSFVRLTVDEASDLETIRLLVQQCGPAADWQTYADYYQLHQTQMPNAQVLRNEGYFTSLAKDENHHGKQIQ